jgi:anti-sigma-K factor RskA
MAVREHRTEYLELCAGYVVGSLDPADREALEAHLAEGCAICEGEIRHLSGAATLLAVTSPARQAPPALKARVMAAVEADAKAFRPERQAPPLRIEPPARRRPAYATWGLAMAAALIAVVGVLEWRANQDLKKQVAETRAALDQLRRESEEEHRWAEVPMAPLAVSVDLAPTPDAPGKIAARITYDPVSRRAVVVCTNFTPPAGRDYELWAIRDTGPASLGVIHADASGRSVVRLPDAGAPGSLGAFAVSLENQGGAPTKTAPAGPVVMLGRIRG